MKKVILYSFLLLSVALAMANVIDTSTMDRANEPISNLKASVSGQDVTLSWDAPMATKSTQTVVLIDEEFENGAPEGWSNLDEDADGYNWEFEKSPYISGHSGYFTSCARSASYHETADELTPDNYLITKELNLKNEGTLSFWVSATSTFGDGEHWAVYASSTGNTPADFGEALMVSNVEGKANQKRSDKESTSKQAEWKQHQISLPAGTKYVAFRHFDCTDIGWLLIDGVKVETEEELAPSYTYTIYRNGAVIAEGLSDTSYTDEKLDDNSYNYCVEVKYESGNSQQVCIEAVVNQHPPISNLKASVNGQELRLSWDAPTSSKATETIVHIDEEFENGSPEGWTTLDQDADGHNWEFAKSPHISGHSGYFTSCARSASYDMEDGELTPNNYLITPELTLNNEATLSFWVSATSTYGDGEHWAVYASSTGNTASDFGEPLLEGNITSKGEATPRSTSKTSKQAEWQKQSISLPAGTKYVAFRHFDCSDVDWFLLDGVRIESEATITPCYTYSVYRDGQLKAEGLTETNFTEDGLEDNTYNYCVEVKYQNANSPKICIDAVVNRFPAVSNLEAAILDGNNVKLTWLAPALRSDAVVLNEDFENGMPNGWTTKDADGDGHQWKVNQDPGYPGHGGYDTFCARSASYDGGALTPDNYLITPKLNLSNGGKLSFWIAAADSYNPSEHWGVYASTTGTGIADFGTALLEETLHASKANWIEKSVELPAGTKYVAFRHFNTRNQFWLLLDDVKIESTTAPLPTFTYTIYRNGKLIAEDLNDTSYTDEKLDDNSYNYCVEVKYESGNSQQVCIEAVVNQHPPISDLKSELYEENNVKLSWKAPDLESAPSTDTKGEYSYTIYRNNIAIANEITANEYRDENLSHGSYNYCVEVKYATGTSTKLCTEVLVNHFIPASNLQIETEEYSTLHFKWDAPYLGPKPIIDEGFENNMPEGWTSIDADGDGHNWVINQDFGHPGHGGYGTYCARSASFDGGGLKPDNYLITPLLDLPNGGTLKFWIAAQDTHNASESWAVYASNTGNSQSDFGEPLLEGTQTDKSNDTRAKWYEKSVELPAGTKYVAFRHYKTEKQFWLLLDDVLITPKDMAQHEAYSYSLYCDGNLVKDKITETNYTIENVEAGEYEYCVEVNYETGSSAKECKSIVVVEAPNYAPVTDLVATQQVPNSQDVVLTWKDPFANGKQAPRAMLIDEGFENGLPESWTTIDNDGDTFNWEVTDMFAGYQSEKCVSSASFINENWQGAVRPDNFLITPELNLENGGTLFYWVSAQDPAQWDEHYAVFISKSGNAVDDFDTLLLEETLPEDWQGNAKTKTTIGSDGRAIKWYQRILNLPAGTKHIAFRHFKITHRFWVNIDDVQVMTEGGENNNYSYTILRDDEVIAMGIDALSYTDKDVAAGSHKYGLRVNYGANQSPIVEVQLNVLTSTHDVTTLKPYQIELVKGELRASCQGTIVLYDLQGRKLAEGQNDLRVCVNPAPYILQFVVDGNSYTEKIIL